MKTSKLFCVTMFALAFAVAGEARASGLQESCAPNQGAACVLIQGNDPGFYALAVVGENGTSTIQSSAGGTANGLDATASNGAGVNAQSIGGNGVVGLSQTGDGVHGTTSGSSTAGVSGVNQARSGGYGVYGTVSSANGSGFGVYGAGGSGGSYGVYGTISSSNGIAVYGAGGSGTGVAGVASGTNAAVYGQNTNSSGFAGFFNGSVNITGNLTVSGTCNGKACSSDIRLKQNVQSLTGSLDVLSKLRPVTFEWKDPQRGTGTQFGFIAQEVEKVKPEWVGTDNKGFRTLDNTKFEVMLVESVRELKSENDALRTQSLNLQDRLRALEANRRPTLSGFGEGGVGLGLMAMAGALVVTRRKRSDGHLA